MKKGLLVSLLVVCMVLCLKASTGFCLAPTSTLVAADDVLHARVFFDLLDKSEPQARAEGAQRLADLLVLNLSGFLNEEQVNKADASAVQQLEARKAVAEQTTKRAMAQISLKLSMETDTEAARAEANSLLRIALKNKTTLVKTESEGDREQVRSALERAKTKKPELIAFFEDFRREFPSGVGALPGGMPTTDPSVLTQAYVDQTNTAKPGKFFVATLRPVETLAPAARTGAQNFISNPDFVSSTLPKYTEEIPTLDISINFLKMFLLVNKEKITTLFKLQAGMNDAEYLKKIMDGVFITTTNGIRDFAQLEGNREIVVRNEVLRGHPMTLVKQLQHELLHRLYEEQLTTPQFGDPAQERAYYIEREKNICAIEAYLMVNPALQAQGYNVGDILGAYQAIVPAGAYEAVPTLNGAKYTEFLTWFIQAVQSKAGISADRIPLANAADFLLQGEQAPVAGGRQDLVSNLANVYLDFAYSA